MKILILGGTAFLGRHLVDAASTRGHQVTLFNRGRTHPDLFPGVERLIGDRAGDLTALEGHSWDAVIDTCGYTPSVVRRSAEALAESADHYTFISSVSVYREFPLAGIDEEAPVESMTEDQLVEAEGLTAKEGAQAPSYGAMYGPLKALCEQAAEDAMPGRVLAIRPGLIVGPHDYSARFTYCVRRVANGGEVLAPGRPRRYFRVIDVRDLAEWTVQMVEAGRTGIYNATGPAEGSTMEQFLDECKAASGSDASFTWVSEQFLEEQEVGPWIQLPLWLPEEYNGFFEVRNDRAMAAGLSFRPLAETVRDTLAWDRETSFESTWNVGLDPSVEKQLLDRFSPLRNEVREATPGDAPAIAEIHNQSIAAGGSTFEEGEESAEDVRRLLASLSQGEALLVLEGGGEVLGWGLIKKYSPRSGYRFTCETAVYVRRDRLGQGIGTRLKRSLIERCKELGYHHLVAKIVADNRAAIEYNENLGYELVGIQKEVGFTGGRWRDVAILQLILADDAPADPGVEDQSPG